MRLSVILLLFSFNCLAFDAQKFFNEYLQVYYGDSKEISKVFSKKYIKRNKLEPDTFKFVEKDKRLKSFEVVEHPNRKGGKMKFYKLIEPEHKDHDTVWFVLKKEDGEYKIHNTAADL